VFASPDGAGTEGEFEKLICAARRGDGQAAASLLENYRKYLLWLANKRLPGKSLGQAGASDLVQESLVLAQRNFGQFKGEREREWKGWLRTILNHRVDDLIRRQPKIACQPLHDSNPNLADSGSSPSAALTRLEEAAIVRHALEQLPEHYQQVIRLRETEELSWEEVGQHMQRSQEAARKLWSRAIDSLGQLLKSALHARD
jgi:RNA polymerase sigma-70 factor, ECF subfamily